MGPILLLFAWLLPAPVQAEYAVIRGISGSVTVKPLGHQGFGAAQVGSSLIAGDTLKTGAGAIVHLELTDGPMLLVSSDSTFVLGGEPEDPIVEFKLGEWLLGLMKKLAKGRRVRISTPHAVAAVRGTLFWGKTDAKETLLAGLENKVEITAAGKTVMLRPGQLVRVPAGGAPEAPAAHKVPVPFLDKFRVEGGLGGVEKLLKNNKK